MPEQADTYCFVHWQMSESLRNYEITPTTMQLSNKERKKEKWCNILLNLSDDNWQYSGNCLHSTHAWQFVSGFYCPEGKVGQCHKEGKLCADHRQRTAIPPGMSCLFCSHSILSLTFLCETLRNLKVMKMYSIVKSTLTFLYRMYYGPISTHLNLKWALSVFLSVL